MELTAHGKESADKKHGVGNLRIGVQMLSVVSMIASCSTPTQMVASKPVTAAAKTEGPIAAFDCGKIQGPKSKNSFYEDNPTYIDPVDDSASWKISAPEAQGMSSSGLERASTAIAALPYTSSFLVIRHGSLVFERYYHGSAKNQSNNVHSASKSIWGAAFGIAIDQGRIPGADATIASILPSRYVGMMSAETKTIKVRDLLTMTSGIRWQEDASENWIERTSDWVGAILKLPRAAKPGAKFNYSTGDTHLSSAVLTSAIGTTACEFTHRNLLAPMGVVAEHWGRDPQGYFSGGYNFYVTPRELAKFGLLYLQEGRWNGRQLVPAAWVRTSMTKQVDAGAPYGFGHGFWLRDIAGHQVAMAWGFGGQMIYIVKDLDLVVVMTTNTRKFDQDDFNGLSIVKDNVLPAAGR
jgi:CubicO group peptidase (beta-lactamase class C family)